MKKRNIQFLMLFLFSVIAGNVFAQQEVTGVVSDNIGELLPGATVMVLGTDDGTVTDFDGNFTITVPDNNSVLVVSFIGMKTIEITVGDQTVIDVILEADSQVMDEVIVTALGISRETKALGYSVSQVDGDALVEVPQENVLNALSGKVSGVVISSIGAPGSSVSMVIRGATSLSSDNQPLFVIDGVPVYNTLNNVGGVGNDNRVDYGSAISDINPDDIESMTVLKGASAAALYGSRAGNGVVLITTKSGKATKGMGVTINSSTVFDIPFKYLDVHDKYAVGQRPYTNDNFPANEYGSIKIGEGSSAWAGPALNQGITAIQWPYTPEEIASGVPVPRELTSRGKDNAANFFETAITSTNNISIQENSEKLDYRLSYTNMRNKGFIPNTDLNRNSVGLNSTYKLVTDDPSRFMLNGLSVSSSLNFTKSGSNNRPAQNRGANPIQALYEIGPHIDVRDMKDYWLPGYEGLRQNSPYTFGDDPSTSTDWNNPYFLAHEVNNSFERNRFYGNARADWKITDQWSLFVRYMFDNLSETRETKMSSGYTEELNGAYGLTNIGREETNADFLITWKKDYENWNFSVSGGGNMRKNKSTNVFNQTKNGGQGLVIPNLFVLSNIAPENLAFGNYTSEKHVNSLYGMASIGYRDIVYLDITGRNDWSSTLPEGNNSYFYPSISASILFDNIFDLGENVSLLKLRGGWAQVGNDTDPYRLDPVLGNAGAWGDAVRLGMPSSLLNPDLLPELQTSWEIGVDLAFLHNRLRFDFTYYEAVNENQIFQVNLPTSSGFSRKWINAGELNSTGWEGGLSGTIITNNDWNWDMGFVFSGNTTTLVELAPGLDVLQLWDDAKGGAYSWEGDEIGQLIDRAMVRVDDPDSPYDGWPLLDGPWENSNSAKQDADGNRVAPVVGNFNPDFILGMTTSVSYKNWSLGMNFDWRSGGQFVSQTHRYGESDMHTQRWLDKLHNLSDVGDIPEYLRDNQDEFLSPDGEFFVLVGGPTAEEGGFPVDDGGITLSDGVFMPGVEGFYDDSGSFVATRENLGGPETEYVRYQNYYGWSYMRNATFDADFIKLREISLAYTINKKALGNTGLQNVTVSLFSRNIILWTAAGIGIDPEHAFQAESGTQGSGIQFRQGLERFNVNPWAAPIGFKVSLTF